MKAAVITRHGGPEVFALEDRESPALPADGLKVEVKAAGVNFADLMMRMGLYPEAPKPPFVPGYEVAGVVSEVGGAVLPGSFRKGDRVLAGLHFGGYAGEVAAQAAFARKIPDHLSFEEAASIPVNWATAWVALLEMGRVRQGDRVLIDSAAGGVGVAAVQIAASHGAQVVGMVGSPAKAQAVKELGAAEVWLREDWAAGKKSGEGFDLVIDSAGGKSLQRSFDSLKATGRVIAMGVSSMVAGRKRSLFRALRTLLSAPRFGPVKLAMANKGVYGINMLKVLENTPQAMSGALEGILKGFEERRFRAVVGSRFPLAEAGKAQEHLASRGNVGKVVLTV